MLEKAKPKAKGKLPQAYFNALNKIIEYLH